MLTELNLNNKIDKKEYKAEMEVLEKKLEGLQQMIKEQGIPVIIAFEGWSASGKGTLIARIVKPLDPRNFNVYTMDKINEDAAMRPVLWSYFTKIPMKGRITIFDKSWHRAVLPEVSKKRNMKHKETEGFYYDVNAFEKSVYDNNTLILKFFLHISKNEQKRRFKELCDNPDTSWRVDKSDLEQNKEYDKHLKLFGDMLSKTDIKENPWTIVEADDTKFATVKIYSAIIEKIETEIERINNKRMKENSNILLKLPEKPILRDIDLNVNIDDLNYSARLKELQAKISDLGYKLYKKRRSVVIVYEGWDAAGKGGNIKRVTEKLDPRGYEVIPIMAPSKEELDRHYLWRFWNKMPKDGHIGIFDRSWYGRVMVERIEGYAKEDEWKRAYKEINDMELHMSNHGTIIFKFWLHIDKEEQLRRFKARAENPLKVYKITDEDWRNREKWNQYEEAINEMLFRTNTIYAPWTIVESNNKKYARIKTLEIITAKLTDELK